ncbi:MAG: hypothetical protein K2X66_05280 [Cyanobacteria bacterium]|nr:hypothetical protein [Cyanobacteriota bacterium]
MIALNWKENSIYIKPYAAIVEKRQQLEDSEAKPSEQPVAPGFKESEINKVRGDRYSTY